MRIYAPSPTVPSSRVPLYMQGISARLGWLGQDAIVTDASGSAFDFSTAELSPIAPDVLSTPPLIAPDISPVFSAQPGFLDAIPTELDPLLAQGFTPDEADLISAASANGLLTDQQFSDILSGAIPKSEISNVIFSGYTPTVGPTMQTPGTAIHLPGAAVQTAAQIAAAAKAANIAQPGKQPIAPAPRVSATPTQQVASALTKPVAALGGAPGWLVLVGIGVAAMIASRAK
jgi:hypothetical protein